MLYPIQILTLCWRKKSVKPFKSCRSSSNSIIVISSIGFNFPIASKNFSKGFSFPKMTQLI